MCSSLFWELQASESRESRNKQNHSVESVGLRELALFFKFFTIARENTPLTIRIVSRADWGNLLFWPGMGEGVVLSPDSKSTGWPKYVFFLGLRLVWNFPFFFQLWLYLSIQNILSFLVLNLAHTDHPRHLESNVSLPSSTSKAKKAVSHSLEGVYKRNIKKQGCFYCDESIFWQTEMWKTVLKLLTTKRLRKFCDSMSKEDPPISRYGRLTLQAGLTFLHSGSSSKLGQLGQLDKHSMREHCWLGQSGQFFLINTR